MQGRKMPRCNNVQSQSTQDAFNCTNIYSAGKVNKTKCSSSDLQPEQGLDSRAGAQAQGSLCSGRVLLQLELKIRR